jgi:hypothetical protein
MYVCKYLRCVQIYVYLLLFVFKCVLMFVYTYVCMLRMYLCMYVCVYLYVHCMYVCINVFTCLSAIFLCEDGYACCLYVYV